MTLKRTAVSKRAALPRATDYAKAFLKDGERLGRSGRHDGPLVFVRAGTYADLFA